MSENQSENQEPILEVWPNDPKRWENEDQVSLIGFFKAFLEADMRINPENWKTSNSTSYEPENIGNSNSTGQTE